MKIDSDDDKDGDDGAPKVGLAFPVQGHRMRVPADPAVFRKYQPLRMPADIRVRKGHSWSDQMGIAVGLLSDRNRDDLLTWVKDVSRHSREEAVRTTRCRCC